MKQKGLTTMDYIKFMKRNEMMRELQKDQLSFGDMVATVAFTLFFIVFLAVIMA